MKRPIEEQLRRYADGIVAGLHPVTRAEATTMRLRPVEAEQRRPVLIMVAAAVATTLAIGVALALVIGNDGGPGPPEPISPADTVASSIATPETTATPPTTTAGTAPTTASTPATTSTTTPPPQPPPLGSGWEIARQAEPSPAGGLADFWFGVRSHVPGIGYLAPIGGQIIDGVSVSDGGLWVARSEDLQETTAIEINGLGPDESGGIGGVVGTNSGVVAYGELCGPPLLEYYEEEMGEHGFEPSCTLAMWFSEDGLSWERIDQEGLFVGCTAIDGLCHVSLEGVAPAPDGRIVMVGADPAVPCGDDCYDITHVAWVSDDGRRWERHELDLASMLPSSWGSYYPQYPLIHTGTRWLTIVTELPPDYPVDPDEPGTVVLVSEDGARWSATDVGTALDGIGLTEFTAGARGIVATDGRDVWVSQDGSDWTRGGLPNDQRNIQVFAYDDGFIAAAADAAGNLSSSIWYSSDGSSWTEIPLDREDALAGEVRWFSLIDEGNSILVEGDVADWLMVPTIWRWSPPASE